MPARSDSKLARRYLIRGRVQGVGYRAFVERTANAMGLSGWVRNLDDGRVEAYVLGTAAELSDIEGHLWKGPRWADVRGIESREEAVDATRGFHTRH